MAPTTIELPLFPLGTTVLFPRYPVPLIIFEPRYRMMIAKCLEVNTLFGIVLIQEGIEVGDPAEPFSTGMLVRIASSEKYPDGRYSILAVGVERFRVIEHLQVDPFRVARVELWPDAEGDPIEMEHRAIEVQGLLHDYFERLRARLNERGSEIDSIQPPTSPEELASFVASLLPIPPTEKQGLLELPGPTERLIKEAEILRREITFLGRFGALSVEDRYRVQQRPRSMN